MHQPSRRGHGPTVRAIREAQGVKLLELTRKTELLGHRVSPGQLSLTERGKRPLSEKYTAVVAQALGVQAAHLTGQLPPIEPLRTALGLSKRELATQLGITSNRLDLIEQGAEQAGPELAALIAVRLGVDPAVITPAIPA